MQATIDVVLDAVNSSLRATATEFRANTRGPLHRSVIFVAIVHSLSVFIVIVNATRLLS